MAAMSGWRPPASAVIAGGAVVAGAVAWAARPTIAADDAAITFRYAERLATGHGLTYNDGEHVLGASSGVHTLLLALGRWAGLSLPSAAVALGVVGTAVCTGLIGLIATRLGGRTAAVVAMFLFVASPVRWHATGGLESTTLIGCCLAAVAAWQAGRERLAGIALGIALVAKLDAGALVVSLVGVSVLLRRRIPWSTLTWTAIAAAPWFLWVWWVYGNPLPQSFLSKAAGRADAPGHRYQPTWALRRIRGVLPAAAAGIGVVVTRADGGIRREVRWTLVGWLGLSAAAVSLIPLGADYPWYVAPLYAPIAVLAGDAVAWARPRLRSAGVRPAAASFAVVGLVGLSCLHGAWNLAADLRDRGTAGPAGEQWQDFRSAGRFVEEHHAGEVLQTCFGWVGFAAEHETIVDPCALNSPWPSDRATVRVDTEPRGAVTDLPGWCEEARFDEAARRSGGEAVVVRVRC